PDGRRRPQLRVRSHRPQQYRPDGAVRLLGVGARSGLAVGTVNSPNPRRCRGPGRGRLRLPAEYMSGTSMELTLARRKKWSPHDASHDLADGAPEPTPIRQFVLKIYSRCNLACDYCYVYTMADQTWRDRPLLMSADVVRLAADRIAEHAGRHCLPRVGVVLHG